MITQTFTNKSKQVICIYRDEREAIRAARVMAKQAIISAWESCEMWQEKVLLRSGDTLFVTATCLDPELYSVNIGEHIESGWDTEGLLHCQKSVADKL